jgi:POT family proton-dependent oligopeptide transporter
MDSHQASLLLQKNKIFFPTGAGALFLIQIFSTLGFSVLYSTLILYATQGLHISDTLATSITGSFIALNYFLHLLGGYIGGRYFSYRLLFSISMIAQLLGCFMIAIPHLSFLLWGLAIFLAGSGLNVTCINCMVTQLFEPDDKRRETAFLWNYSGMNIGFLIGFSMGGVFYLHHTYTELFIFSGLANLIALILTLYNWKALRDRDTSFLELSVLKRKKMQLLGIGMLILLTLVIRALLNETYLCNMLILIIGFMMLLLISLLAIREPDKNAQNKMWGYIILVLSAFIFWTLYQLAPMGLNLFIERNVDRNFFGFLIAPQWVQNINTLVIIFGGPLLGWVLTRLREQGIHISIPLQFSIALLSIGIAFAILPIGIRLANPEGYVSFTWIALCYVLQSVGELLISPIGYAMIGQLAPIKLRGFMMGMWMMVIGVSAILSDYFSKMALGQSGSIDPLISNPNYSHTFSLLGWSAIIGSIVLFLLTSRITALIQEKRMTHSERLKTLENVETTT